MTEYEALWESHILARYGPPRSDPYYVLILVDFHQVKLPEPRKGDSKGVNTLITPKSSCLFESLFFYLFTLQFFYVIGTKYIHRVIL